MRVVALVALLAACTDEPDPCAGIDGQCVVLRVESDVAMDSLQLGITIGSDQSIVARPLDSAAPFLVPINVGAQPIDLDVVAAASAGSSVVAAGAVTVAATAERTDVTLTLGPVLQCVEGGSYCGGDKLYGDPTILYTCRTESVPVLKERCEHTCLVADPGKDDVCSD